MTPTKESRQAIFSDGSSRLSGESGSRVGEGGSLPREGTMTPAPGPRSSRMKTEQPIPCERTNRHQKPRTQVHATPECITKSTTIRYCIKRKVHGTGNVSTWTLLGTFDPSKCSKSLFEFSKNRQEGSKSPKHDITKIHSLYHDLYLTDLKVEVEEGQNHLKYQKEIN